jgi:hypothetical protein
VERSIFSGWMAEITSTEKSMAPTLTVRNFASHSLLSHKVNQTAV